MNRAGAAGFFQALAKRLPGPVAADFQVVSADFHFRCQLVGWNTSEFGIFNNFCVLRLERRENLAKTGTDDSFVFLAQVKIFVTPIFLKIP